LQSSEICKNSSSQTLIHLITRIWSLCILSRYMCIF